MYLSLPFLIGLGVALFGAIIYCLLKTSKSNFLSSELNYNRNELLSLWDDYDESVSNYTDLKNKYSILRRDYKLSESEISKWNNRYTDLEKEVITLRAASSQPDQ